MARGEWRGEKGGKERGREVNGRRERGPQGLVHTSMFDIP